jgi:hypothetical protein
VEHKTPHGVVSARCVDSPEGLFARPKHRPPPPARNGDEENQRGESSGQTPEGQLE